MVIIGHRFKSTFGANNFFKQKERAIKAAFLKGDFY